jgi:hypothetical protein
MGKWLLFSRESPEDKTWVAIEDLYNGRLLSAFILWKEQKWLPCLHEWGRQQKVKPNEMVLGPGNLLGANLNTRNHYPIKRNAPIFE